MIDFLVAILPIVTLLFISEFFWLKKTLNGETARKLVHIFGGIWVAFWPYYLPIAWVQVTALIAALAILVAHHLNVFKSLTDVKRNTYGEVMYPVGVFVAAVLAHELWIFTTAVLFIAVADGLAGMIGKKFGKKNQYKLFFGNKKSVTGSLVYFFSAMLIMAFIGWQDLGSTVNEHVFVAYIGLPAITTIFENFTPYGLDNLLSPLIVVLALNNL